MQALLPLEDLETTSTIPSRLDRGLRPSHNNRCDHPAGVLFAQYRDNDSSASDRDLTSSMMSLLPLFYVVLAARVALTRHRYYPSWDGPLLMLNTSQLARVALKIRGKYKGRLGEIAIWESERTDNRRYREGEIFQSQSSASGESRVHYQRFTSEVDDGR